jgi:hypothetical protein
MLPYKYIHLFANSKHIYNFFLLLIFTPMLKDAAELVAEVQIDLGLQDDNARPILKRWAYEAVREIGTTKLQDRTTDWLLIENNEFCKPKDMIAPVLIQITTDFKHCYEPKMAKNVVKDECCKNTRGWNCDVQVEEKHKVFWLSTNNKHRYARIHYISVPLSESGEILIDDNAERAVKQYIIYQYLKRQRRMERGTNTIPMSEVQYEYDLWVRLRKEAMGRISMPNVMEMIEVGQANMQAGLTLSQFSYRWSWWYATLGAFAN